MRSVNHPHVRTIMRTMDRALVVGEGDDTVRLVGSRIIERDTCERFLSGRANWTDDAVRAVVLVYALNAPAAELEEMARASRKQLAWIEWWELEGRIEVELTADETPLHPRHPYSRRAA